MSPFQNTFGWARAEVLGALVNAVFLVALCFSITVESLKRFYDPEDIHDPQASLLLQGSETRLLRGWEKLLCACLTLLPGRDWVLLSYVLHAYFRILYVDPVL